MFDVSRGWSLYLNLCVKAFSSEDLGAPGATVPFSVETIILDFEGGRYVVPLIPATLIELVIGRLHGGGNGGGVGSSSSGSGSGVRGDSSGGGGVGGSGIGGGSRSGGSIGGAGRIGADAGTGVYGGAARVQMRY